MLGVEAMALYRYVPGREQLLDAVVERIVDGMASDPEVPERPEHGWQDYLQRLAHGIRRVALAHPKAFPLVASRPAEAPWLRPPLRSLRWVESFLDGLAYEGFSDAAGVEAYRAFTSFLLGHLLLEVAAHGADLGPLDVVEEDVDKASPPTRTYGGCEIPCARTTPRPSSRTLWRTCCNDWRSSALRTDRADCARQVGRGRRPTGPEGWVARAPPRTPTHAAAALSEKPRRYSKTLHGPRWPCHATHRGANTAGSGCVSHVPVERRRSRRGSPPATSPVRVRLGRRRPSLRLVPRRLGTVSLSAEAPHRWGVTHPSVGRRAAPPPHPHTERSHHGGDARDRTEPSAARRTARSRRTASPR